MDDFELEFIEMSSGLNKTAEHRVMAIPAFIFFRGKGEIERPKESMEKDIVQILKNN